jgi:hypothetical protein
MIQFQVNTEELRTSLVLRNGGDTIFICLASQNRILVRVVDDQSVHYDQYYITLPATGVAFWSSGISLFNNHSVLCDNMQVYPLYSYWWTLPDADATQTVRLRPYYSGFVVRDSAIYFR